MLRYKNKFDFDDIFYEKATILAGEPGFGKTWILKQIVLKAIEKDKTAFL